MLGVQGAGWLTIGWGAGCGGEATKVQDVLSKECAVQIKHLQSSKKGHSEDLCWA